MIQIGLSTQAQCLAVTALKNILLFLNDELDYGINFDVERRKEVPLRRQESSLILELLSNSLEAVFVFLRESLAWLGAAAAGGYEDNL